MANEVSEPASPPYGSLLDRIVRVPGVCGGVPVIRGMRWPVYVVLGLLASGADWAEILEDHPELETDDLRACLQYASELATRENGVEHTRAA